MGRPVPLNNLFNGRDLTPDPVNLPVDIRIHDNKKRKSKKKYKIKRKSKKKETPILDKQVKSTLFV